MGYQQITSGKIKNGWTSGLLLIQRTSLSIFMKSHLGSWMRKEIAKDENGEDIIGSEFYNYRELAVKLAEYGKRYGLYPCRTAAESWNIL